MKNNLEILNNDDVISVLKHDEGRFTSGDIFKILQLLAEYESYLKGQTKTNNHEIFMQGIEWEVLRQNSEHKGWRKGKIKFVVQFEPDEISSNRANSLDDIRHQINQ